LTKTNLSKQPFVLERVILTRKSAFRLSEIYLIRRYYPPSSMRQCCYSLCANTCKATCCV